jgi:solute carrier family 13 (sodium-dependent dicarboxylate transporter), member 2/3/5
MMAARVGFWGGIALFLLLLAVPAPEGLTPAAWRTAAIAALMATWWMTEALPITATAFLPFILAPLFGVMPAEDVAGEYYSSVLFLLLGGAFIALAIERVGLHRRVALAILARGGATARGLLLAMMSATALLSMLVSNTATALIMLPIALSVVRAGRQGEPLPGTDRVAVALTLGVAYAATIGGLGTLVGSPTNVIAAGLIGRTTGYEIDFLTWSAFGMPIVLVAIPLTWWMLSALGRLRETQLDAAAVKAAIGSPGPLTGPEKRLIPIILAAIAAWATLPLIGARLPEGAVTDGTVGILAGALLLVVPGGDGRPLLTWKEARAAPWDVIMMFGGGLALAALITSTGLAQWIGDQLSPLTVLPLWALAAIIVVVVIIVTEFASNVAAASGFIPVVAGIVVASAIDPALLAVPAAMAASWGFMLPSGTGPNALAFGTGELRVADMVKAGFLLDLAGVPIIVGTVFAVATLLS